MYQHLLVPNLPLADYYNYLNFDDNRNRKLQKPDINI